MPHFGCISARRMRSVWRGSSSLKRWCTEQITTSSWSRMSAGPGGVAMHESADVALFDELGQRALRGQLQLAQVLAQLGRNGLQPEQAVQRLFGLRLQRRSAVEAGEAVLGDAQAFVARDPA